VASELPTGESTEPLVDPLGRRFRLLALLGRGAFGEVYLAHMQRYGGLDQHVAVKLLRSGLAPESQAMLRLKEEGRTLGRLNHPVVLAAHDLVELAGRAALITEYIDGQDLGPCIAPGDPQRMPPSTVVEVTERVASALDAAWPQLRVVHRDVKPSNIRIGRHGQVKLLDFGIARSELADRAVHTVTHTLIGTFAYMAPERFDVDAEVGPASDVFALGCVLYEGITGVQLFGDLDPTALIRLSGVPEKWEKYAEPRLARLDGLRVLPEGLPLLVRDMTSYWPEHRPTAGAVVAACERILRDPHAVRLTQWCRARTWPASPTSRPTPAPAPPAPKPPAPAAPADRTPAPAPRASPGRSLPPDFGRPRPAAPVDDETRWERTAGGAHSGDDPTALLVRPRKGRAAVWVLVACLAAAAVAASSWASWASWPPAAEPGPAAPAGP
jgi:serine/threonine-protein kinase